MLYDTINWSLQRCKEEVIKYQQTNDSAAFHNLLARFDRYILHIIYEMKKKTPYLWNEDMQELYHTGILGFHKGISAFKIHLDPFFLVLVIKAYVKSELRQAFAYKIRETGMANQPVVFVEEEITRELDVCMLFELLENSLDFTDRDRSIMNLRFKQDKTVEEIAHIHGITGVAVYKQIEKLVKKLKVRFNDDLKDFS